MEVFAAGMRKITGGAATAAGVITALLALCIGLRCVQPSAAVLADSGYAGSPACAKCHPSIYESFSRTDMGRSMSAITPAVLGPLPTSAEVLDSQFDRHFSLAATGGKLYQSEYQATPDGKEIFRSTHQIEWLIGAGANGIGAIVRRGDFLFEAPLSFYTKADRWGLSPGYEFGDYGFDRPILPGCIACHSGEPRPVEGGNGKFEQPPFAEVAIGCENCHGPGQTHIAEMEMGSAEAAGAAIANPAKLSSWLADNICMSCHQAGDARVLRPGKQYRDFHPGEELDNTVGIFLVPFGPESAPKDDLLEHYLSMRLSKCYRASAGKLACITCHDPHVQPTPQEAPAYFRNKCLTCHTEKSCALPVSLRQHQMPPDDCAGCHMPKREVKVISHSVLTNHRILAEAEEPFPDAAFHMTTPQLPDLVHLSANPAARQAPSPLTLLQAYGQVMLSHPSYRERYWAVAQQLQATQPDNVFVQQALADRALRSKNSEQAVRYLEGAVHQGSTSPADFEQLARLLIAGNQASQAVTVLRQGMTVAPYDAELYRLGVRAYLLMNQKKAACDLAGRAMENFPQDGGIRRVLNECNQVPPAP